MWGDRANEYYSNTLVLKYLTITITIVKGVAGYLIVFHNSWFLLVL